MGDLAVTVSLRGQVIEDRVLPVRQAVRLGEGEGASVAFPDADLLVVRVDGGLCVRGRTLAEGETLHLELGDVEVTLAHVPSESVRREPWMNFDHRFLLIALLAAALGTWLNAAAAWVHRVWPPDPGASASSASP